MELHHSKHHKTYIDNLNVALKKQSDALQAQDLATQLSLQPSIKFNGGGHINHALFWENLVPAASDDAAMASAPKLMEKIHHTWGSVARFREDFKATALSIQGSGWVWLIKVSAGAEKRLAIVTTKDQDPVVGPGEVPILGVDMWEHAYYLQVPQLFGFDGKP
jgi:Fe-Mn family superoxide dismutase